MPSPTTNRRPLKHPGASRQLILGKGESVRKKARREYESAKRKLDQAHQDVARFKTEDRPAFDTWMHRTFGQDMTRLRQLGSVHQDKAQLLMEVEQISFKKRIPLGEAYRLALHRRAHPEERPTPKNVPSEAEAEFAKFSQAYADRQDNNLPPGFGPPGLDTEPGMNARVKDLYRSLVRKLHPDSQGQMTPEKLEWWHEVQEAYAGADIARLEQILTQCELQDGSTAAHASVSLLQRLTAQFKTSLRVVRRELTVYRRNPAWRFSQSSDRAAIERQIRAELEVEASDLAQMIADAEHLFQLWARQAARPGPTGKHRHQRKPRAKDLLGDDPSLFC